MKSKNVTNLSLVFGGNMVDLLPKMEAIPEEFKRHNGTEWNRIFSKWFFVGLPKGTEFEYKECIDGEMAMRHMLAIMKSWEPKLEHKEAGVAYLMSQWLERVIIPEANHPTKD